MAEIPVTTLAEAAPQLRRPFAPEAIKFRPVGGGNIVAYVDARCVIERLNAVIPGKWETRFEPFPGGKQIICHLTIDGVTRSDVGTQGTGSMIDPVKAGYSDAIKRAAVHFGCGVSLYALPAARNLPAECFRGEGKNQTLSDVGLERLRNSYGKWLEGTGKDFGEPLSHGDSEGSIGDIEAAPSSAGGGEPVEQPSLEVEAAKEKIRELWAEKADKRKMSEAKLNANLRAVETLEDATEYAKTIPLKENA